MKATSGAHIFKAGGRVIKIGSGEVGKRVHTQAHYCRRFDPAAFPVIHQIFPRGCVMERLEDYTYGTRYVADVTRLLREFVWTHPSNSEPDWHAHLTYIMNRVETAAPGYAPRVADFFYAAKMEKRNLRRCQVHGDPTYDNMMQRGRDAILIDPLPPYAHGEMPELAAVDIGKIMQSLIGYEAVKYGSSPYSGTSRNENFTELHDHLAPENLEDEWVAAHWFLITHIVRLIPYQPAHKHEDCIGLLRIALNHAEAL